MKITEYASVTDLDSSNVFLIDGDNGTKTIKGSDLTYALFDSVPEMHSQIWRGKNLGETFTSEQSETVRSGKFHDLWIGDYWEKSGVKYRIVDIDYFYRTGKPRTESHHLVIMPDDPIINEKCVFGTDGLDTSGYTKAAIRTGDVMTRSKTAINAVFGSDHILSHYEFVTTMMWKSAWSDAIWYSTNTWTEMTVEVPTFTQLIGSYGFTLAGNTEYQAEKQFSGFRINRKLIATSNEYSSDGSPNAWPIWTRTFRNGLTGQKFEVFDIGQDGAVGSMVSDYEYGLRPYFCVY